MDPHLKPGDFLICPWSREEHAQKLWRLRQMIAAQDRVRGRPLTDAEKLENLRRALAEPDEK